MNELYTIREHNDTINGITAQVDLNPEHPVFSGHFPGQPVLPGVCMMELVCSVAEKKAGRRLRITGAPMIKFLHMVDPRQSPDLQVEITMEENAAVILAEGRLLRGSLIFVRFRLELSAGPE